MNITQLQKKLMDKSESFTTVYMMWVLIQYFIKI